MIYLAIIDPEKKAALKEVSQDGWKIRDLSKRLRADKDVMLAALSQACKSLLRYESRELKKDKAVIDAALSCKS